MSGNNSVLRNTFEQKERHMSKKTITIDGVNYVPENETHAKLDGMPYVIVRSHDASPFAGYLESRVGREVVLREARRLWYWAGAASLSQMAVDGVQLPEKCKFPCVVGTVELLEACEVLYCTYDARESIASVPVWEV